MAVRKNPTVIVKVLRKGKWGGDIVRANGDYATGGPIHPDVLEALGDDAPDPTVREGNLRYPGDVVSMPIRQVYGLPDTAWGVTDEVGEDDPEGTRAFVEAINAGKRPIKYPAGMELGEAPADPPPADPANPPADD